MISPLNARFLALILGLATCSTFAQSVSPPPAAAGALTSGTHDQASMAKARELAMKAGIEAANTGMPVDRNLNKKFAPPTSLPRAGQFTAGAPAPDGGSDMSAITSIPGQLASNRTLTCMHAKAEEARSHLGRALDRSDVQAIVSECASKSP